MTMAVEMAAARRRFTRAEYYRMAEVGILGERDHVELIRGEIVEMSPIGRRHKAFVGNLARLLISRLGDRAVVHVQSGVVLSDDTEPEPDLSVLRPRSTPYKEREAHTDDVLALIEVADTSLAYDRSTKLSRRHADRCGSDDRPAGRTPGNEARRQPIVADL